MSKIGSTALPVVLGLGLGLGFVFVLTSDRKASAQFPNWKAHPVRPNIDVIPPLGNHLPLSYRARMNRPSYISGRIAYTIEPSSQEAMAWQRAWQRGYYANHAPRMETHYIYPKAWEVLGVDAKPKRAEDPKAGFVSPDRLPLKPMVNDPSESVPEPLETPPAEPETDPQKPLSPQALVPAGSGITRPELNGPTTLELAPEIQLAPDLRLPATQFE